MTTPPTPIAELWSTCSQCQDPWQHKDLWRDEKWNLICWACDIGVDVAEDWDGEESE